VAPATAAPPPSPAPGLGEPSPSSPSAPPPALVAGVALCAVLLVLPMVVGLCYCVSRRRRKNNRLLTGECDCVFSGESPSAEHERRLQEVLREQGALPRLVITAVASTAAVLVFVNILVVLCVLRHRQNKKQRKPSGWLDKILALWWRTKNLIPLTYTTHFVPLETYCYTSWDIFFSEQFFFKC